MSGELTTSDGNTVINKILTEYILLILSGGGECFPHGDDSLDGSPRFVHPDIIREAFARFG